MRGPWLAILVAAGCSGRAEPLGELPPPAATHHGLAIERTSAEPALAPADVAKLDRLHDGPYLRVLGTAQDGGLPHAACTCRACDAARRDPAAARLVASLAAIDPALGRAFLIDATPDIHEQLHALHDVGHRPDGGPDRAPVEGVLLTHAHIGHYLGLALLGFEAVHTHDLPVWASRRMSDFLRHNGPWDQLVRIENIELRPAIPMQRIALTDALGATPVAVPHRDEYTDTLGFLIDGPNARALYVPDSSPWKTWPHPLPEFLVEHQVDIALLDATFYSGDELPGRDLATLAHPLVVDTMDLLQPLVDAKQLRVYFTHLNHSNPALAPGGAELAEIRRRGFYVADDGLEVDL